MTFTLDAETEQRIQREIDLGHAREPAEVIARAMALLDYEEAWLLRNKEAINEHLEASLASLDRGEGYTPEQAREILAQRRLAARR